MEPTQQNPDALYQSYDKTLYKLTGNEQSDAISDMLNADPSQNNSMAVSVPSDTIGSGVDTSTTITATGSMQAGKKTYDNTATGYILGVDPKDGAAKFYIGNTTKYINWDGTTLSVVGGVSISSLDIPDTTTASSMHVDTSGNTWWGSNVASGLANANASITAAGAAVFKNISVGGSTTTYTINNSGIYSFGDGSDGVGAADGSTALAGATLAANVYTLTRDVYFTNLTISTGITIKPSGYRIFGTGTLTMNGTALIHGNGNNGTKGTDGTTGGAGGAGGAALADGYLKGSIAGPTGGTGGAVGFPGNSGGAPTNTTNSIGKNGVDGGNGGTGEQIGGSASGAGIATASNVKLIANWHLATLLDISSTGSTVKFDNSASSGAGGGGGGSTAGKGGGGGGAGSGGRIIAIYFRNIVIGVSASITANGGNGLYGGDGQAATNASGGGGGGGGNGGQIVLIYNTITNNGSITANGGTFGTGGLGIGTGGNGANGTAGQSGNIRQFQISI